MTNKKPFEIKFPLQLWNLWLAVFSIIGSLITSSALVYEIYKNGLVST